MANSNLNNRIKRDLVNVNITQGSNNIIEVERDLETWIPFLITDPQSGTFNAVTNFWGSDDGGKIGITCKKMENFKGLVGMAEVMVLWNFGM